MLRKGGKVYSGLQFEVIQSIMAWKAWCRRRPLGSSYQDQEAEKDQEEGLGYTSALSVSSDPFLTARVGLLKISKNMESWKAASAGEATEKPS